MLAWSDGVFPPRVRGVGAGCNTKEVLERLRALKAEIEDLDLKERELDQQKSWLQRSIRNVMDDAVSSRYPSEPVRSGPGGPLLQSGLGEGEDLQSRQRGRGLGRAVWPLPAGGRTLFHCFQRFMCRK